MTSTATTSPVTTVAKYNCSYRGWDGGFAWGSFLMLSGRGNECDLLIRYPEHVKHKG